MANKYPGYNESDTFWDDYHRKNGMMTNREFFTSNAKGGFYEGMEWDEDSEEWVPDRESRERQEAWDRENRCQKCGYLKSNCDCDDDRYYYEDED